MSVEGTGGGGRALKGTGGGRALKGIGGEGTEGYWW